MRIRAVAYDNALIYALVAADSLLLENVIDLPPWAPASDAELTQKINGVKSHLTGINIL